MMGGRRVWTTHWRGLAPWGRKLTRSTGDILRPRKSWHVRGWRAGTGGPGGAEILRENEIGPWEGTAEPRGQPVKGLVGLYGEVRRLLCSRQEG